MMNFLQQLLLVLVLVLLLTCSNVITIAEADNDNDNDNTNANDTISYVLIGVSGGLQEGFPAHSKLHYYPSNNGNGTPKEIKAIYLGKGLVRGYRAYLDLMEPTWREYQEEPAQPYINSNVFASGCYEHANEYWLYFVHERQVMSVLQNEPRFLSLTPDTGSIELAAKETWGVVRKFFTTLLQKDYPEITNVAIPLVTCVYFHESSHLPSPPISRHDDGTMVTNFPDSLAKWANVNDTDRTAVMDTTKRCSNRAASQQANCSPKVWVDANRAEQRYWKGIRKAIRHGEQYRPSPELVAIYGPPWKCKQKIRFGVDDVTSTRVNYPITAKQIDTLLKQMGYQVNFDTGEIAPMEQGEGEEGEEMKEEL